MYDYLNNTFTDTKVIKQDVEGGRSNILLYKARLTEIEYLVVGHIDTVQPRTGWNTDPFKLVEKNGWLYGLGSADMKGSLATFVTALESTGLPENVLALFYVDEEYDFKGVKRFIQEYKGKINPRFVLSLDGGGPDIGYACRGLGEIKAEAWGQTGHSSDQGNGVNAVVALYRAYEQVVNRSDSWGGKELGKTTLNLAYVNGGLCLGKENGKVRLGKEGNNIPDYCEFVLEARLTDADVNMERVADELKVELRKGGCKMSNLKVRHNLGVWISSRDDLSWLKDLVQGVYGKKRSVDFMSPRLRGYVDTQMLWQAFGKIPCATLGIGPTENAHAPNERVSLDGVENGLRYYKEILGWMKSRRR